jgi:hypothetical protein
MKGHHDRALDFEGIAKGFNVVGPLVEGPVVRGRAVATTLAALVEVNDLGDIGEW